MGDPNSAAAANNNTDAASAEQENQNGGATEQEAEEQAATEQEASGTDEQQQEAENQDEQQEKTGAPEKYEFELPEGLEVDPEIMGGFEAKAKELGLNQKQAQELFNLGNEAVEKAFAKQTEEWGRTRQKWRDEIRDDKEFGGKNYDQTLERAKRTLRKYGDDSFLGELEATGLGDNAGLVKMLAKIDKAMGEDVSKGGDGPKDPEKETGDSWYKG